MARLPPNHYNKLFGGKLHGKGPASTKTLTTNTHTTTTGVSSVLHDPSVPRTYLFDIYKNEAESHFEIGEYRQAADCYNAAVKLQPNDTAAIIARSRCYAQMGRWKRAMKDCDAALSIDAAFGEALFQKAEILHVNGNLDLALVYFKRALKQHPESIRYKNAVHKVSDAIHKQSGVAAHKASKLTAVGDLSMFLHSKVRSKRGGQLKDTPRLEEEDTKLELPSAGFRARFNVAPLIRINRKPGVSILRTYRSESARSNSSASSANRDPDEATMRTILGELYGDRKYLKKFQNNLPGGKAERDLTLLADEGLEFLRERTIFWDSLGPLPPPQVPKRSNMRERSFFMTNRDNSSERNPKSENLSLQRDATYVKLPPVKGNQNKTDSADEENYNPNSNSKKDIGTDSSAALQKATSEVVAKRKTAQLPRRPKKKKKIEVTLGLEKDYSNVDFKFRSLQPSRSASRLDEACPDAMPILRETGRAKTRVGRTMFVGFDDPEMDRKRQLTKFINKEMDVIDEAFKTGEFEDCHNKANICLRTVASLPGDDINKSEVVASLHSCIGNACIAMNDFEGALRHHMEALAIGENEDLVEVVNRSLGHLGRMYIIQKRFNKALEVFARKAPAVSSAEEIAQVFHEIGNCFLALGHLDYARDCGKKALRAAQEADIHYFKFQSWVLIAVSESRMKHHDEAYKAFDEALALAKSKDDEESVNVILFAMEHLSKTITSIMKKRAILSERLMSRGRTQTILDLNKRPHAARVKKRKKRVRREDTDLDEAALTRQTTSVYFMEPVDKAPGADDGEVAGEEPVDPGNSLSPYDACDTTPRADHGGRRTSMFEKSPRELEPFGDPSIVSKKKQEKIATIRVHSRHGVLDRMGSGSRRGSWAGSDEPPSRTGSQDVLPSPHRMVSAKSTSRVETTENVTHTPRQDSATKLPPLKPEGSGILSDAYTPRADISVEEDGFLSQREEYYSKSRTGRHNAHRGGFHSNRESRAESNDPDVKHYGSDTPREGGDATEQMGGAKSGGRTRHKRTRLQDTSLEEQVGNGEESYEAGADVTGGTNAWYGDLSSGRLGDLSGTMEISFRTPLVDDEPTPRVENQTKDAENISTQYGDERRNSNNTKTGQFDNSIQKTPGRFTRESYFDENETNAEGYPTDGGATPEHISVSRQRHVARNIQNSRSGQRSHGMNQDSPRTQKGAAKASGNGGHLPVERSSSKVSLRGIKNEDMVATFETSKPYRVSSATSERNAKSSHSVHQDTIDNDNQDQKKDEAVADAKGVEDCTQNIRPEIRSPAKSQVSALTTGSGWEGDVSTETDAVQGGSTKEKRRKPKSVAADEHEENNEENGIQTPRKSDLAQQEQKSRYDRQDQSLENGRSQHALTSNDDDTLPEITTEESTVASLRPCEVQEEVIKKTMEAPTEDKRLVVSSKVAYLDQKHANKVWRESRDLDDIQSVPYSSRADLVDNGNKADVENKPVMPESDLDQSVTLPVSIVSSEGPVAE